MAKYVIEDTTLTGIADAIREKTETTDAIPVTEMRPKILGITSGGMTASIFVTGLSETDTVTASYGDKTKVAVWNSAESRHEITGIGDKGMWTVTATNGKNTKTQDVLVDGAFDYEIAMSFKLWLYREGDECEDVTGGWSSTGYTFKSNTNNYTLTAGTKNNDSIYVQSPGANRSINLLGTNDAIDLTGYTNLCADIRVTNAFQIRLSPSKSIVSDTDEITFGSETTDRVVKKFSLVDAGVSGSRFITVGAQNTAGRNANVYNLWLE